MDSKTLPLERGCCWNAPQPHSIKWHWNRGWQPCEDAVYFEEITRRRRHRVKGPRNNSAVWIPGTSILLEENEEP